MRPDYSIIIPAYNEEELLPATLASVGKAMQAVSSHRGEIVVADNDSSDRTAEIARDAGARVVYEEHRQIARARNSGVWMAVYSRITSRILESGVPSHRPASRRTGGP